MKRLLLLGPVVDRSYVGGLQLALMNLGQELQSRGWEVEGSLYRKENDGDLASTETHTALGALQGSRWLIRVREVVPAGLRQTISALFWPQAAYDAAAQNLRRVAELLRDETRYDAVLVCPDSNTPGMLALALTLHPRVVVISLTALAEELQPRLWSLVRRKAVHPFFYRPAKAEQIGCAVFASDLWRKQAVREGLAEAAAHTIYFGIPLGSARPRHEGNGQRLLWVGRLAPEKGLHLLIAALPSLQKRFPNLTLTAVAGQGEAAYRVQIEQMIAARGLEGIVRLLPPVAREDLSDIYANHDLLFFHSSYGEPVALVLMEAYAVGLPVVANAVMNSELVCHGENCLTYDRNERGSIVAAVGRLLSDDELRQGLAGKGRALVEAKYSLIAMGDAYDRLIRRL